MSGFDLIKTMNQITESLFTNYTKALHILTLFQTIYFCTRKNQHLEKSARGPTREGEKSDGAESKIDCA